MKKYLAFTFIEMMIALTVFSIGVLAVMRLITQNLSSMDVAETTTIATFLAKEWLELTYNIRDSNIQKWLPWHCLLDTRPFGWIFEGIEPDDACVNYFSSGVEGKVLLLGFSSSWYLSTRMDSLVSWNEALFSAFRLYRFTDTVGWRELSWYGYTWANGQESFFARYIIFTWVQVEKWILPLENILKIESHVLSRKWSVYKDTVLESFIGKQ